jgi:multiple antibiotic resistance protein
MDLQLFGTAVVTLFVIVDPPGSVPIFLALTRSMDFRARNKAAWQAVWLSFGVIVAFAVAGGQILKYLGISLPAMQAAGGLLLLLVALELLTGKQDDPDSTATSNVALVPLGTPLLAGPGAIVASIVFVRQGDGITDYVAIAAAIVAVHAIILGVLRFSNVIVRVLKQGGIEVLTRISGLLVAAIAVQLIADAIASFVRQYGG